MFAALVVTRVVFWWTARSPDKGVRKLRFLNMVPSRTINFMGLRKAAS